MISNGPSRPAALLRCRPDAGRASMNSGCFYGAVDLIPTEHYTQAHAETALESARFAATVAADLIGQSPSLRADPAGPSAE